MESVKYLGFDVHQSNDFCGGSERGRQAGDAVGDRHARRYHPRLYSWLRGTLHLTFEEGTHSAWLYDLLARGVARVVVCNPRQNALLKAGNKSDTAMRASWRSCCGAGLLAPV